MKTINKTIKQQIVETHSLFGGLTMYEVATLMSNNQREFHASDLCLQYRQLKEENRVKIIGTKDNIRRYGRNQGHAASIYALV